MQDHHLEFFRLMDSYLSDDGAVFSAQLQIDKQIFNLSIKAEPTREGKCVTQAFVCEANSDCSNLEHWLNFSKINVKAREIFGIPVGVESIEFGL